MKDKEIYNCINCGAPLHGDKCEYCETEYSNGVVIRKSQKRDFSVLRMGDEEIPVYIKSEDILGIIDFEPYMDCNGFLHRSCSKVKRIFTAIEK